MILLTLLVGCGPQPTTPVEVAARPVDPDPLVVLVFGDAGREPLEDGSLTQAGVGAAMAQTCAAMGCDLALMLGDNIYEDGVSEGDEALFWERFEEPFAPLGELDIWAVLGNHDWRGLAQPQLDHSAASPRWRMPDRTYVVPGLPAWVTLAALDTQAVSAWPRDATTRAMLDDTRAALCGAPGWRILFAHHPLQSSGIHSRRLEQVRLRRHIEPIVEDCGVQLVLSGHEHHQEHIVTEGYDQLVSGAASKSRPLCGDPGAHWPRCGRRGTPGQQVIDASLGYAVLTLTPERADIVLFRAEDPTTPFYTASRKP
ncbi:MAG: metallophosphoesterase [Alphaproteobacteria bacterium]|nr:metallophosphoesterase [Alphaproteobacteria bacterium]